MGAIEKDKKEEEDLREKCAKLVLEYDIYGWSKEYFKSVEEL